MVRPVALFFLIRRDLRALVSLAGTLGAGLFASLAVLGPTTLIRYVVDVLPLVDRIYAASLWNLSLRSVGPRLFAGTASPVQNAISAPPLIHLAALAGPVGLLLPLVAILAVVPVFPASRSEGHVRSAGLRVCRQQSGRLGTLPGVTRHSHWVDRRLRREP